MTTHHMHLDYYKGIRTIQGVYKGLIGYLYTPPTPALQYLVRGQEIPSRGALTPTPSLSVILILGDLNRLVLLGTLGP